MRDGIADTVAAAPKHPAPVQSGPASARVAIVADADVAPAARLASGLEQIGFWDALPRAGRGAMRVAIKPELGGFSLGSPLATDPALVEALIDLLHAHGLTDVAVV